LLQIGKNSLNETTNSVDGFGSAKNRMLENKVLYKRTNSKYICTFMPK